MVEIEGDTMRHPMNWTQEDQAASQMWQQIFAERQRQQPDALTVQRQLIRTLHGYKPIHINDKTQTPPPDDPAPIP